MISLQYNVSIYLKVKHMPKNDSRPQTPAPKPVITTKGSPNDSGSRPKK